MLTKGFLVKIVPEVPFILKQLSTSPSGVKEEKKQTNSFARNRRLCKCLVRKVLFKVETGTVVTHSLNWVRFAFL